MRKFNYNIRLLLGLFLYLFVAAASGTGGGGPSAPACNESTVSLSIKVNWQDITTYQYRVFPPTTACPVPNQMACLPSNQTCNGPDDNDYNKGIVKVLIKSAAPQDCSWARVYEYYLFRTTPGLEDVISEVPNNVSIKIELSYYEACTNCTTISSSPMRAFYKSETLVPQGQISSGATIQLNTPAFVNVASCD